MEIYKWLIFFKFFKNGNGNVCILLYEMFKNWSWCKFLNIFLVKLNWNCGLRVFFVNLSVSKLVRFIFMFLLMFV